MAKRKPKETHYDIPSESDDEESDQELPRQYRPVRGHMLQESTYLAEDGRVRHTAQIFNVKVSPKKTTRGPRAPYLHPDTEHNDPVYDYVPDEYDNSEEEDGSGDESEDEAGQATRDSDDPLGQWAQRFCDVFLDEELRSEGRGEHRGFETCPQCSMGSAVYRCMECLSGGGLVCKSCIVERHQRLPLHVVQHWNGGFFERKALKDLGLRIQLGHWHGRERRCAVPERVRNNGFVIIDDHGVHDVGLDFCGCGRGGSHYVQLLRAGLLPATGTNPRTAPTFSVMRRFQLLSFESKCSAYHFYQSLARETDNMGLRPPKNRYTQFRRLTRMWDHIKMLKRAGRGNDPSGRAGTAPSELCPACPQPGKNLPPNWEDVPEDQKFLYALFVAIDANFRLKRKDVSSEEKDPGLARGWAFYGDVQMYMAHLAKHRKMPQERSHCVSHDAVDKPDREARGTASSGIGAVDCARHNMKRPQAVGDLQLGERYINMDYMFFSSIAGTELQRFYVSYDIACQWHINIWNRMEKYEPRLHFDYRGKFVTFLVPKFHLPAHIEACNLLFSFNLTRDVGQTDGEAPERGWANSNPMAGSTKEMGPGARRDAINAHFNDWNHKKIVTFGRIMRSKTLRAGPEMVDAVRAREELEQSLTPESVATWLDMAVKWEVDSINLNPFETLEKDDHLAKVRADLAKAAAERAAKGEEDEVDVQEEMHVTEFVAMGLQLEEQQIDLKFDIEAMGQHPTDDQRRTMIERSSKLRWKIGTWIDTQVLFFPVVTKLRELDDKARKRAAEGKVVPGIKVEDMSLWLPSAMWKGRRGRTEVCKVEILEYEYRMRVGQGSQALDEIWKQLLVR
ncbi:hypothetical protein DFH07DRAFT_950044 [Mycena maculata]|uniref:CxC2-like cysteine cluster KDZ transposase-associated domain-containing protein n=1 Tax=Mycena maculata TaxID=230809 RepID=A0AAD7NY69_9AGAR|nr:hypothetical protein DFH07DRAFT_950044 [Mycena maculata]